MSDAAKLHLLKALSALIRAGADVNARNGDLFGLGTSGFKLLPECGGQTALHLLCAQREKPAVLESCQLLLKARADVTLVDNLHISCLDVAKAAGNAALTEILVGAGAPVMDEGSAPSSLADVRRLCKAREDDWNRRGIKRRREDRQRALDHLQAAYKPRFAEFYTPDFLATHVQKAIAQRESSGLPIAAKVSPGVFYIERFISEEVCESLLSEIDHFQSWADSTGYSVARPNSMNRYGMVLGDIGFHAAMHNLMEQVIQRLANEYLYVGSAQIEASQHFQSQHSFVVRYKVGEDVDLKKHQDDADVTLNICLGRTFKGADVYFHEFPQKSCAGECKSRQNDEQFVYRHSHVPGTAILHFGKHIHGVLPLEEGERINLILWCRLRPYPPEVCQSLEEQSV
eukprot:TRINITY_DN11380_c0_g1_i2.p1 TRINITY_DN11380_c0_g1~~TRINITY_DN11380_c0_g1_i2.p1  ORF type:complete len:441 (-),score=53.09 TRINITY_DN11380_c0_g1_i2:206-1405(-)